MRKQHFKTDPPNLFGFHQSVISATKTCSACRKALPLKQFNVSQVYKGKSYLKCYCRKCDSTRRKKIAATPKGAASDLHSKLKQKYGVTLDEFNAIRELQGGVCAICQQPESELDYRTKKQRRLAVDHCHDSKRVRGLLCAQCNKGLGCFSDSPERLHAAIAYLLKFVSS